MLTARALNPGLDNARAMVKANPYVDLRGPDGEPTTSGARVIFLDYLRIFAFVSVLVWHKFDVPLHAVLVNPDSPWQPWVQALWPWIQGGGAGVLVFFLVSGYVITQVLQRERTKEFLIKRALRIYPLYVTAVLVHHAGQWIAGHPPAWPFLLPQLLLIGDWFGTPYALTGIDWTLRLEVMFYLLMAGLHAGGLVRWRQGAALPWVYAVLAAALYGLGPIPDHPYLWPGYASLYFPFLLLGSVVFLCEHRSVGWGTLAGFGALVFALHHWGMRQWQAHWIAAHFAELATGIFMLLWLVRRWLPARPWVLWWSSLTYSVYLFHDWLFDWLRDAGLRFGASPAVSNALALAALFAICAALVRCIERPAIALGRRLAARWAPVPHDANASPRVQ